MSRIAVVAASLLLACIFLPAHAQQPANSCADPYWQNTLRCKMLAVQAPNPMPPPQPQPDPPANVGAIKPFTRVELPDPEVRCVDGTRPIIYVDKAVGPPSNRWLISTTGGESCAAGDFDGLPGFENGNECLRHYVIQQGQLMGTATEESMSTLADDNGNGILSNNPLRNPVFARYNRIRVHKCGFDRHSGRATHLGVTATVPNGGPTLSYDLYSHGQKIVLEALDFLLGPTQQGLSYSTWINAGGTVTSTVESLPSIANAEQVLLVGHSAAAHGLYQNADRIADHLRAMPGFNGDVRVVHDAQFMPSVENEAAFDPLQNPNPAIFNTLFQQRMSGVTNASGAYDSFWYHGSEDSHFADTYRAWLETPGDWAGVLDSSCVATHTPSNDVWKCTDRFHVRLHHESTPALLREDFADPNDDHNNVPFGHMMWWGTPGVFAHCDGIAPDFFNFSPCVPSITFEQNKARLIVQASHFREGIFTLSEMASNADPSPDAGSIFIWMPECGHHSGVYDDAQFLETSIVKDGSIKSYREFLQDFAAAPASGLLVSRIAHLDGATSECAPVLLRDGFE